MATTREQRWLVPEKRGGRRVGFGIRVAGLVVVALLLAWQISVKQIAQAALDHEGPAAALQVDPRSAAALAVMAADALANKQNDESIRLALDALRATALSPLALRTLMIAHELDGNAAKSRSILRAASRLGWRDEPVQIAQFAAALQARRMAEAAIRLDAIARASMRPSTVYPLIDGWLSDDGFRRAMIVRLSNNPPWRQDYLAALSQLEPAAVYSRLRVAIALTGQDREQARSELTPYVRWLLAQGDYGRAYLVWYDFIADRSLRRSGGLYDGDFRSAGTAEDVIPFEWLLSNADTASAAADRAGSKSSLRVQTDGTADARVAEQAVILAPGTHALSVEVSSTADQAPPAFQWKISCGPERTPVAAQTRWTGADPGSATGHGTIQMTFIIPSTGCPYQYVGLYLSSTDIPDAETYSFSNAILR